MLVSDLTVEVRNSSLARVGQILPADLRGLELALRFNKVGSWKLTLRSDHPLADTLRAPGAGLIVTGPSGVIISGPTVSATNVKTSDDPTGTWEVVGLDDSILLGERLAYPVPSTADLTLQTSAYDSRTGKAETIAKAFVDANMGPSAPVARRVSGLTVDTDLGRGSTLAVNARFDKLGELLEGILVVDGLGFDIRQNGASLVFEVFQPVDRSTSVRMDVDNLRLTKSEYTYTSPEATRVIVAGQGEGAARVLLERTSSASTAAETAWGRRIEVFKDSRNTADTTALQSAGDEILSAGGKTVEGIKVSPSDDQTMRYGVDWGLGDKVTVVVGSTQVSQIVTEVAIVVTDEGVKVGATVGNPVVAGDGDTAQLDATTTQEARISNLERSDTTAQVGTTKLADGSVTTAKLASSVGLSNPLLTRVDSSNEGGQINFARASDGAQTWYIDSFGNTSTPSLRFIDGSTERLSLNGSGAVLFGGQAGSTGQVLTSAGTGGSPTWSSIPDSYNYVLNGGFDVWQRGTSLATAANALSGWTADRWQVYRATYAAGVTVTRQAAGLTGFTYCARIQRNSANTSTANINFANFYESAYCLQLAGRTVTLSFWLRKGANYSGGAVTLRVYTGTGTDERRPSGFTGAANSVTGDFTPSTTWTRYSVTGTIPAGATQWSVDVLWTPTGTAGASDYIEVTGVQLEEGSVATDFHRQNASLASELAACQYYYYRNTPGIIDGRIAVGIQNTTTTGEVLVYVPTEMRTAPTPGFANIRWTDAVAVNLAISALALNYSGPTKTIGLTATFATGGAARYPGFISAATAAGYLELSAEL